jgi:hypothetical protein
MVLPLIFSLQSIVHGELPHLTPSSIRLGDDRAGNDAEGL